MGPLMSSCLKSAVMRRLMRSMDLSRLYCLILFGTLSTATFSQNEIPHTIHIIHKGISLTETVECSLIERRNTSDEAEQFYMDVESVVCGDSLCRVDIVRLYWDTYARFLRLELPEEVALEKAEGKAFTQEDYAKLDRVLKNEHSPLKDLYSDQIVGSLASEGVDAVSRASVSINKKDYVEGAIWTCYSLWHWVHGDTQEIIRNLRGDASSTQELKSLLSSKDTDAQIFAIEQLGRRKAFSLELSEGISKALKQSPELLNKSLEYWEQAPEAIYMQAVKRNLAIPEKRIRLLFLGSLFRTKYSLDAVYLQSLPLSYEKMSYQEIQLLLRILDKHAISSPALTQKLISLLDQDDFLIARAVYWHLADQELNATQEKRLAIFYTQWKKKL